MLLLQVSTIPGPSSMEEFQFPALSIQRLYWLLSHMLPCCPALALRGLLSARDNMLMLNGVSSPGHFSLILISLPLTFYGCLYEYVYLYLPLLSTVSLSCCHSYSSSILTFPSISPLTPLSLSLFHPVMTTGAVPSSALARARTHQAFLMLLHSAAAAALSSFPLSPLWLCLLLLSPGVVSLPSASSEVVSHRDYSLIPGDLEIFLRDDVRHVK